MSESSPKDTAQRILADAGLDGKPSQGKEYCGQEDAEERCLGCGRNMNIIISNLCVLEKGELAIQPAFRRKDEAQKQTP